MTNCTNYTVIGAGHGGKAMAAHLALMGFSTTLYNRTPDHIHAIKELKGILIESTDGEIRGFGKLALVTSNIAEAFEKADVVMVVVPGASPVDVDLVGMFMLDIPLSVSSEGKSECRPLKR